MKKNIIAYLVPLVLVMGTAFGIGLVTGDTTEGSDVTVGVQYVAPTINITEYPDPVGYHDDVNVTAEVTAPGHENVVEEVVFEFNYTGGKDTGEAYTYAYQSGLQPEDWEEGVGIVEYTWSLEEGEMWRTDCTEGEWSINATVYGTEEDCWDYDEKTTSVELYREINWAEDGEATGAPGEHLYGDDFENEDSGHPTIKITTNDNWELELGNYTLEHETEDENISGTGDYEQSLGTPVFEHEIKINYNVTIPYGSIHGTYRTEGDPATHTLITYCQPISPENDTAFGGDSKGEGPGWWYYYNTSGEEEQTVWAGQDKDVGTVEVSEPDDEGDVTITIDLKDDWKLEDIDESVKIQGYEDESDLPDRRPAAGLFDTYKGEELEVTVESFEYYIIHLDVEEVIDQQNLLISNKSLPL